MRHVAWLCGEQTHVFVTCSPTHHTVMKPFWTACELTAMVSVLPCARAGIWSWFTALIVFLLCVATFGNTEETQKILTLASWNMSKHLCQNDHLCCLKTTFVGSITICVAGIIFNHVLLLPQYQFCWIENLCNTGELSPNSPTTH